MSVSLHLLFQLSMSLYQYFCLCYFSWLCLYISISVVVLSTVSISVSNLLAVSISVSNVSAVSVSAPSAVSVYMYVNISVSATSTVSVPVSNVSAVYARDSNLTAVSVPVSNSSIFRSTSSVSVSISVFLSLLLQLTLSLSLYQYLYLCSCICHRLWSIYAQIECTSGSPRGNYAEDRMLTKVTRCSEKKKKKTSRLYICNDLHLRFHIKIRIFCVKKNHRICSISPFENEENIVQ